MEVSSKKALDIPSALGAVKDGDVIFFGGFGRNAKESQVLTRGQHRDRQGFQGMPGPHPQTLCKVHHILIFGNWFSGLSGSSFLV